MKIIKFLKTDNDETLNALIKYLESGGIVFYPTDTVYGIGCLATNKKAINKIFKIKNVKPPKPLIVLINSYCMLHKYCYVSRIQEKYIRSIWPPTTKAACDPQCRYKKQPTTFILKSRGNLPKEVLGEDGSIAVRLPKNDFLLKIIAVVGEPIISTSLNLSGKKTLTDVKNIDRYFKKHKPDLVIDAGEIVGTRPSRIVDIRELKPDRKGIKIIR